MAARDVDADDVVGEEQSDRLGVERTHEPRPARRGFRRRLAHERAVEAEQLVLGERERMGDPDQRLERVGRIRMRRLPGGPDLPPEATDDAITIERASDHRGFGGEQVPEHGQQQKTARVQRPQYEVASARLEHQGRIHESERGCRGKRSRVDPCVRAGPGTPRPGSLHGVLGERPIDRGR